MYICFEAGRDTVITLEIRMEFISSCQLYFILCSTVIHVLESFFENLFILDLKVSNITDSVVVFEPFRSKAHENLT